MSYRLKSWAVKARAARSCFAYSYRLSRNIGDGRLRSVWVAFCAALITAREVSVAKRKAGL
jgi:hypothetical protein